MNPQTLASGAVCTVLLIMALFCIAWYVVEYGVRQLKREQEYDEMYERIKYVLSEYEITEQTYDYIMILLERLGQLKWKNIEMTDVLYNEFKLKYNEIHQRRIDLTGEELPLNEK